MAFGVDDGEGRLVGGTLFVRCWWVAGRGFRWRLASMMAKAGLFVPCWLVAARGFDGMWR